MPRRFLPVLAIALSMYPAAHGQSLGDIARANREKQNAANPGTNQPAVITSDDLGQDSQSLRQDSKVPDSKGQNAKGKDAPRPAGSKSARGSSEETPIDPRVAAQWKRQILAQEDKIALLQGRIDEINASLHPAGSAQFEGPYNRYQTKQMERLADIQLQLDQQKKHLVEMQDEARRAGMHTTVYDP